MAGASTDGCCRVGGCTTSHMPLAWVLILRPSIGVPLLLQVRIGQWAQMSEPASVYDTRQTIKTLVHPKYDPNDFAGGHDATLLLLDAPSSRSPVKLPKFTRACLVAGGREEARETGGQLSAWVGS